MAITFADTQITVRPNNSLSPLNGLKLLVALASLALVVALGFMHIGAWLVLPFAGLELIAFAGAFYYLKLHADDFETITILDEIIVIEQRVYKNSVKIEFQRYWARVNLRQQADGESGLFIGSHGKEVEFGRGYINEQQRIFLAKQLRVILQNN
ncbi:MAG: DUF2244 domain-containing protein [Methylotenera sp.]|nr:DUF2244 domain-containing protein [Methylotenera sp.]